MEPISTLQVLFLPTSITHLLRCQEAVHASPAMLEEVQNILDKVRGGMGVLENEEWQKFTGHDSFRSYVHVYSPRGLGGFQKFYENSHRF